jgi:hypothetical protein
MPYLFRIAGALALLWAVTACSSSSSSTPSGPNPSSTTITVLDSKGARLDSIAVTLSTGNSNGQPTGIIRTESTNGAGNVTFGGLPPSGQLCVQAKAYADGRTFTASYCADPFPGTHTLKFSSNLPS